MGRPWACPEKGASDSSGRVGARPLCVSGRSRIDASFAISLTGSDLDRSAPEPPARARA